jgi:hypothetical protein
LSFFPPPTYFILLLFTYYFKTPPHSSSLPPAAFSSPLAPTAPSLRFAYSCAVPRLTPHSTSTDF